MKRPFSIALLLASGIILLLVVLLRRSPGGVETPTTGVTPSTTTTGSHCPLLVWSDEFNGSLLDTEAKWGVQLGNGCDIGLCGWGNQELQSYTAENAIVSNGTLKIVARQEANNTFTSSRIRTIHKADFLHGRFEARIKLPAGQGIWPAFWMMPTNNVYGVWPRSGEIDIMENIGHEVFTVHGTLHYSGDPSIGNHMYSTQSVNLNERFADGFHEFAIEKHVNEIRWYLDGAEYFVLTHETVLHWPFEEQFHFILNVAIGGQWPGNPDETTMFPQVMEVDYVRVHDVSSASFGKLVGPRVVLSNQKGVKYSLDDGIWDSYSWEIPVGATFTQNLANTILVDFGGSSGIVKVMAFSAACGETKEFSISVTLGSSVDFIFVDGADTQYEKALLVSTTGTYTVVPNPNPDGSVNPSANVIQYIRDGGAAYDTIFYSTSAIGNPEEYINGRRRFSLDVFTGAPAGTPIVIQLENSARANPSNYPIGRHSRFQATLPDNANLTWTKLPFAYLDRPDAFETEVDNIVIMFHPNSLTTETYYFDNLVSFSVLDP